MMTPRSTLFLFLAAASSTTVSAFAPQNIAAPIKKSSSSELHQTLLHDVEAGKAASWAGARYGDTFLSTGHYSPSETHGTTSTNAMDAPPPTFNSKSHHYTASTTHERSPNAIHTSQWVSAAHAEAGNDVGEWSGARRGDYGVISRRASPTASTWLE